MSLMCMNNMNEFLKTGRYILIGMQGIHPDGEK